MSPFQKFCNLLDTNDWAFLSVALAALLLISFIDRRTEKKHLDELFRRYDRLRKMRGDQ